MDAIDRLAADMDKHGIKKCIRWKAFGACYVELTDGRNGQADTFANALRLALDAPAERLAA